MPLISFLLVYLQTLLVVVILDDYWLYGMECLTDSWLVIVFSLLISHSSSYLAGVTFDRYVILKLTSPININWLSYSLATFTCRFSQMRDFTEEYLAVECELIMGGTMAMCSVCWCVDPDHGPEACLASVWPAPHPRVYNIAFLIACKVFWQLDKW